MGKKLKIKLLPNGQVEMITEGIKGKKCEEYIPFLEKIADVKAIRQEYTQEYYENANEYNQDQEQEQNRLID